LWKWVVRWVEMCLPAPPPPGRVRHRGLGDGWGRGPRKEGTGKEITGGKVGEREGGPDAWCCCGPRPVSGMFRFSNPLSCWGCAPLGPVLLSVPVCLCLSACIALRCVALRRVALRRAFVVCGVMVIKFACPPRRFPPTLTRPGSKARGRRRSGFPCVSSLRWPRKRVLGRWWEQTMQHGQRLPPVITAERRR
jgi:hypothetical protein